MGAKRLRITSTLIALATTASILTGLGAGAARAAAPACASDGCWTAPFSPFGKFDKAPPQTVAEAGLYPAAASAVMMPNGRIVYWNGLQDIENCGQFTVIVNGGCVHNSRTEVLDLTGSTPLFMAGEQNSGNDLFCSDQRLLQDGTVLDTGGTYWAAEEPAGGTGIPGANGLIELYGSKDTRVFDPSTQKWTVYSNAMHEGRWYPTMLTLPSGDQFVSGGVAKLLWNSSIMTQVEDAIGNKQYEEATAPVPENNQTTEIWHLDQQGHPGWTLNPAKDNVELPLYARMHLLPDGEIFYSSAGQMWGPAGESVNELDWMNMKLFDPSKIGTAQDRGWRDAGMLQFGNMSGAMSVLMPIDARNNAAVNAVKVLVAGGTVGPAPGSYLATNFSQMVTLNKTSDGWSTSVARTGDLNNRRWFSSTVLLPNGQVVAFNGADKDEVVEPGTEVPIHQAELFDPATSKWTPLSSSGRDRTYHNTAILLPDGSVLVGGHAPINQLNGGTGNALPLDQLGFVHNLKDPSFERFYPPYLYAGPRPELLNSQKHATWGTTLETEIAPGSVPVDHFVLTRLPAQTHITDADARTIILKDHRDGNSVHLDIPANRALVTPGFYYLFGISAKGVPSVATIVQIADPHYYTGGNTSVLPVNLVSQEYRGGGSSANSASQPAAAARAAKMAASSSRSTPRSAGMELAGDVAVPAGAPIAPSSTSRTWLIVIAGLMIAIVARRVYAAARR